MEKSVIDLNSRSEFKCYHKTRIVFIVQFSSHTVCEEQMGRNVMYLNFMHKVKCYRKTSIIFVIGEHGSR